MLKVFGEHYYLDLDEIEDFVNIKTPSKEVENHISVVKYDMVKVLVEVLMSEPQEIDEALGERSNLSVPFKLAFNSLLNKKLLNKY